VEHAGLARRLTLAELGVNLRSFLAVALLEPMMGIQHISNVRWLAEFWSWPAARREAWRRARLYETLAIAARDVPFYRRLLSRGVLGDDPFEALHQLPSVDKATIREREEEFLSVRRESIPAIPKRTGGSTGEPWQYALDKRAWSHMYAAQLHFFERAGVRYGERMLTLGVPVMPGTTAATLRGRLRRRFENRVAASSSFEVDDRASLARAREAVSVRAALWYGYAGTIAAMADAVLTSGVALPGPRAIVTMAEPLQPAWRERIELAFGAPVFDEYGCNDGGVLAQSCAAGRFHLAENLSIVEILDGDRVCEPGEEGDVAITNLHARVLPFIRYRNADRAELGDGPCPCGQPGETLLRVLGRTGDRVELPDGTSLSVMTFAQVFKRTPGVRRWQVVQKSSGDLVVRLDVRDDFTNDEQRLIVDYVVERTRDQVRVRTTTTEPIDRTPAGKHKVVVRERAVGSGAGGGRVWS
ncbi:MAG TPA: hypothetical protein VF183_03875, partial [Acidimicrobiales bacterium]